MTPATICVDEAHQQVNRSDGATGERYVIAPSATLVVETGGYPFVFPTLARAADAPDVLFVATSPTQHFTLAMSPLRTRYVLAPETLVQVRSQPFDGFRDGMECALVIGRLSDGKLDAAWMGLVDVRR